MHMRVLVRACTLSRGSPWLSPIPHSPPSALLSSSVAPSRLPCGSLCCAPPLHLSQHFGARFRRWGASSPFSSTRSSSSSRSFPC
ncbi:amastin-like surface protein, putative [Leishmania donovani]|uniref:Amastin-like surface protein, putative n=1 Tax=Leishmania donovani TaxID=5661 RepID=E9BR63_LEIDO|nr:amastin-like surface protein, putative [Leishmania donovani]CBZ37742.1 amastin-like surface protein, putative [Leishmania donovani]